MELHSIVVVLSLAFGLGMLHALDADHIMAVTGLASRRPDWRTTLRFCLRWAIGHGVSLSVIGAGVLLLGMAIPDRLSAMAEHLVGVVLVAIGAWLLWSLYRRGAHLHFHVHDNAGHKRIWHAHWHVHGRHAHGEHAAHGQHAVVTHDHATVASPARNGHRHDHSAVLVGVLHGTAGSAPLLALLPLAKLGSPWLGLAYLVLFGLGVIAAMLIFGGVLGGVYAWLARFGDRLVRALRTAVALSSIGYGLFLLHGAG